MKKIINGVERYFIIQGEKWVECSKEIHDDYYRYTWNHIYNPQKRAGVCSCTRGYYCKGDCETCRYYHCSAPSIYDIDVPEKTDITESSEYEALRTALFHAAKEAVEGGDIILGMMIAEMTLEEMAGELNISTSAVQRRKERIRKAARKVADEFKK